MQRLPQLIIAAVLALGLAGCGAAEDAADQAAGAVSEAGNAAISAASEAGAAAKSAVADAGAAAKDKVMAAGAEAKEAVVAAAAGAPDLAAGEATYGRFCFSCHAAGVAGAPKLGDEAGWAPRVAKGLDGLVASTIAGIPPGMPARGLCMNCSDDDLRNAVAWMIAQ